MVPLNGPAAVARAIAEARATPSGALYGKDGRQRVRKSRMDAIGIGLDSRKL
jgi:hypothetical protein